MEYQKKILGIIFIIAGAILIVFLSLISSLMFTFPEYSIFHPDFHSGNDHITDLPGIFRIISLAGCIMLILLLALPSIIVGIGLVRHKLWADDLILPLGCFYLLFFPLGTALGIYGLVVFFGNRQNDYKITAESMNSTSSVH